MIVPLFPLGAVLFPGGRLPLRVFEPRYMDMVKAALRDDTPFGISLIAAGHEVARSGEAPAKAHATGTLARVDSWDMPQLGILHIAAVGSTRFRILRQWSEASGLVCAEVVQLLPGPVQAVPAHCQRLIPLLRAILAEQAEQGDADTSINTAPALPHRFDDAGWVSMRFAEFLPIPASAKQTLLEVDDDLDRLEIIFRFLASKALLPDDTPH
jgi:uncharacterized protein